MPGLGRNLRSYAVGEHVLFHRARRARIGPGEVEAPERIRRATRVVAVLVAVCAGNRFVRLRSGDLQVLPGGAAVGGKREEPVGLFVGAVAAGVVERYSHLTRRGDRDLRVEVVGVVGVVVDLDFGRPGNATIIGGADVGVGVAARWVLIKIGFIQPAGVNTGLVDGSHGERENSAAALGWNGNEKRSRVDAEVGNDVRGSKGGTAIG